MGYTLQLTVKLGNGVAVREKRACGGKVAGGEGGGGGDWVEGIG